MFLYASTTGILISIAVRTSYLTCSVFSSLLTIIFNISLTAAVIYVCFQFHVLYEA
jgi:hypothetical protein